MAQTMKIKKGDLVQFLSGKDRGKQGKVLEARPRDQRVIVEQLNMVKRHRKPGRSGTRAAWAGRRWSRAA